jgi:hypothetical protein
VRAAVLVSSAVAATLIAVGGGVLALGGGGGEAGRGSTPFATTPLAGYDTTTAVVARGPFCDQIDLRQAEAALDGTVADSHSWRDGDTVEVSTGVTDVVHEFGCEYAAADGTVAHAWVYAPPVTAEQATRLVRSAGRGPGCEPGDGPAFGDPTLALTCTKDGVVRASYRGLFGDAWLVCEVVRPAGATWDVTDRAGRWCVGVLDATGSGAGI